MFKATFKRSATLTPETDKKPVETALERLNQAVSEPFQANS
jgi:hypothetical protein